MAVERTLSIIKPDAVAGNHIGDIYNRFEKAGLKASCSKNATPRQRKQAVYAEHKERPFYNDWYRS